MEGDAKVLTSPGAPSHKTRPAGLCFHKVSLCFFSFFVFPFGVPQSVIGIRQDNRYRLLKYDTEDMRESKLLPLASAVAPRIEQCRHMSTRLKELRTTSFPAPCVNPHLFCRIPFALGRLSQVLPHRRYNGSTYRTVTDQSSVATIFLTHLEPSYSGR